MKNKYCTKATLNSRYKILHVLQSKDNANNQTNFKSSNKRYGWTGWKRVIESIVTNSPAMSMFPCHEHVFYVAWKVLPSLFAFKEEKCKK